MNESSENTLNEEPQQAIHIENSVQRKLYSTELNMQIQEFWTEKFRICTFWITTWAESQKQQLLMAKQWADQAQRERIHLCSELEMKTRLHQECYARSCQEMKELKRRCYQEENATKQRKLEECTSKHDQESRTANLLRHQGSNQVRRLQEGLGFIEDPRIFRDPDSPSSSSSVHVPHQASYHLEFQKA